MIVTQDGGILHGAKIEGPAYKIWRHRLDQQVDDGWSVGVNKRLTLAGD